MYIHCVQRPDRRAPARSPFAPLDLEGNAIATAQRLMLRQARVPNRAARARGKERRSCRPCDLPAEQCVTPCQPEDCATVGIRSRKTSEGVERAARPVQIDRVVRGAPIPPSTCGPAARLNSIRHLHSLQGAHKPGRVLFAAQGRGVGHRVWHALGSTSLGDDLCVATIVARIIFACVVIDMLYQLRNISPDAG